MAEKKTESAPTLEHIVSAPGFAQAIAAAVDAYLKGNLADLVAASMPETPEQQAQRQRESYEETVRQQGERAARKRQREDRAAAKAARIAAEEQAERDEKATEAFANAEPFTGDIGAISDKIVRAIAIDNGVRFSPDHKIDVRPGDLVPSGDGGLLLVKPIELAARSREFAVQGISLLTDAGMLRIALNGTRKCGNGNGVLFPANSLVFRAATLTAPAAADGDDDSAE